MATSTYESNHTTKRGIVNMVVYGVQTFPAPKYNQSKSHTMSIDWSVSTCGEPSAIYVESTESLK